jgi:hypothetical protein
LKKIKRSLCDHLAVCLCIPHNFLGYLWDHLALSASVSPPKIFFGFYAGLAVSKESRFLVLSSISGCIILRRNKAVRPAVSTQVLFHYLSLSKCCGGFQLRSCYCMIFMQLSRCKIIKMKPLCCEIHQIIFFFRLYDSTLIHKIKIPLTLFPTNRVIHNFSQVDFFIFYFIDSWCGLRLSPLGTSATIWPIVPAPDDRWWVWSSRSNENWQGKPKCSEKTCPSTTLSTTNPTWPYLGWNPGRRAGKAATNRLSYGTAFSQVDVFQEHWAPNTVPPPISRETQRPAHKLSHLFPKKSSCCVIKRRRRETRNKALCSTDAPYNLHFVA